jgi:hypothetical protein
MGNGGDCFTCPVAVNNFVLLSELDGEPENLLLFRCLERRVPGQRVAGALSFF